MGLRGPHGAKGERGQTGRDGTSGLPGANGRPAEKGEKGKTKGLCSFVMFEACIWKHSGVKHNYTDSGICSQGLI